MGKCCVEHGLERRLKAYWVEGGFNKHVWHGIEATGTLGSDRREFWRW